MRGRKYFGLLVLLFLFAFCPSLFAVSYTWDFTNGAKSGNGMTFTSNGVTVTVTAWYVYNSTFKSATLGDYSTGLGDCSFGEFCSGSTGSANNSKQIDNMGNDDFLLFQFSAPVDPTSIQIKSPTDSGLGVSYWLGSTKQSVSLTNMNTTTSLSTLGFGSQTNSNAGSGSTRTIDFGGSTTSVNAILFGAMYGASGDNFEVYSMSGSGWSVPEPSSIALLFTVAVAALVLRRRAPQLHR